MTKLTHWLSNKWNLIGVYTLCSFLIGMVLYKELTTSQMILTYILIGIMSGIVWIIGVSRGMLIQALMERDLKDFLKKIRKSAEKSKD